MLDQAVATRSRGPYQLQAAIAALHAKAPGADAADARRRAQCRGRNCHGTGSERIEAAESYRRAIALVSNPAERAYLEARLRSMESAGTKAKGPPGEGGPSVL